MYVALDMARETEADERTAAAEAAAQEQEQEEEQGDTERH
jgi:hypothetical protein